MWTGLALGVLLACVLGYILLRIQFLTPMKRLKSMVEHLPELDARELRRQAESISGMPGETARAIADQIRTPEALRVEEETGNPVAEEIYKMLVVDEICRSLLPEPLKEYSSAMTFSLAGGGPQGQLPVFCFLIRKVRFFRQKNIFSFENV